MKFQEQVPLAPYTTFRIGGPARWFVEAGNDQDVLLAAEFARQRGLPLLVLGGGSNLLIADEGFPGLVLHLTSSGVKERPALKEGKLGFSVAAGENWDEFVSFAVTRGCAGIECLAGIPGTVGGTPIQNVGAYGQEVSSTIASVHALDLESLAYVELPNDSCSFGYRTSLFNTTVRGRYIVTRVDFELSTEAPASLGYRDVAAYFAKRHPPPALPEVAAAVREIRRGKGMLLVEGDANCRSAGSFFKNPILGEQQMEYLRTALAGQTIPQFPSGDGLVKVPAAWLLEQAGFFKGYELGEAAISTRHTLALVNRGDAKAGDILALRDRIVAKVSDAFGVSLEAEPVMAGFESKA